MLFLSRVEQALQAFKASAQPWFFHFLHSSVSTFSRMNSCKIMSRLSSQGPPWAAVKPLGDLKSLLSLLGTLENGTRYKIGVASIPP